MRRRGRIKLEKIARWSDELKKKCLKKKKLQKIYDLEIMFWHVARALWNLCLLYTHSFAQLYAPIDVGGGHHSSSYDDKRRKRSVSFLEYKKKESTQQRDHRLFCFVLFCFFCFCFCYLYKPPATTRPKQEYFSFALLETQVAYTLVLFCFFLFLLLITAAINNPQKFFVFFVTLLLVVLW